VLAVQRVHRCALFCAALVLVADWVVCVGSGSYFCARLLVNWQMFTMSFAKMYVQNKLVLLEMDEENK